MLAGELGLTLAWRVRCVAACQQLANRAAESVRRWCERETEAVSVVLAHAGDTRLVLGSLLRCQALVERVAKRKFRKADRRTAALLANWAAVFTHPSGTAFSDATVMEMEDDYTDAGLIPRLMDEHAEALGPAFAAACGEAPVGGRLAWEVGLPKSFYHDREAKLAVGFPEWDVRRGRFHLDYSRQDPWLELFAGRRKVFAGRIQVGLEWDGIEQHPCGDWSEVCEYSDDDVHYLEIEQPSGAIEPIGTSQPMSKKDINYELRLRHGEHLVKVQQIQYPINHKNFFDNLGFSWSFTTSHGRTMSLQGWFGWTDYRAQARVKPDDGYMCEGDTGSCAAAPINTFTAPAGCEIYSFEVGPSGNQKLTNAPTRPIGGDAEVCHADKHCNGNGVALGNTADGCQCMCNDGYGADDCSCDKSPACLGATVIRARASNVPVPVYVEIEHPDGKLKQYGDASFRGQTNEEFRLLPDECLVSAALTQFPANHEPTKDHEWYTWKFVTSKEREFGFKGWWSFTDGQCTGGTCESVEVSTFTASVGESIHALEFDLNNVLSGVITYPCGGKIPTTPTTAPPPPWVGEEDMYYQKSGVGTWGGTCTCPSGEVYYVGDNNDYCGSLACNGGVAGTCDQSLPQSGWLMAVDCGAPRPTSSSTTVLTTTQKPIATPKPTTTTEGQPCKSGSPGDPSKCKCGFDSVVDTAPGCTLTVCKVCPGCKEESSQLSSELDDERAKAAELQRAVDSLKQQVLAAQSCKA